jgi:hypothetical protein
VKPKTKNFGLFRFVSMFRTYIQTIETNRTVSKLTKTTLNFYIKIPKYALYQTVSVGLLLFWFNPNIETLCFGLKAKQPKQTISKQIKTNRKKRKKPTKKIPKYAPYQTFSVGHLFVSVQWKHRKYLCKYRRETNVLFRILPNLVSVPVSVLLNQN